MKYNKIDLNNAYIEMMRKDKEVSERIIRLNKIYVSTLCACNCDYRMRYMFEGLEKNYIPDFFIEYKSGIKKVIEIKPKCFVEYEINQFKFQAAKDYCQEKGYVFEIWTEEDIKKLL